MSKIFISYKRQDKAKVFPIVNEIQEKTGYKCWIDLNGIESGDQFEKVIINAIEEADIVIFMLSKNFIAPYREKKTGKINNKKQTFPEKEVKHAIRHDKRLVPISIDGTTVNDCSWLEFNCSDLNCTDWENADQRSRLFVDIHDWLNGNGNEPDSDKDPELPTDPEIDGLTRVSPDRQVCLHVKADHDCEMYRFGKKLADIKKNVWVEVLIHEGEHEFTFIDENNKELEISYSTTERVKPLYVHFKNTERNQSVKYSFWKVACFTLQYILFTLFFLSSLWLLLDKPIPYRPSGRVLNACLGLSFLAIIILTHFLYQYKKWAYWCICVGDVISLILFSMTATDMLGTQLNKPIVYLFHTFGHDLNYGQGFVDIIAAILLIILHCVVMYRVMFSKQNHAREIA